MSSRGGKKKGGRGEERSLRKRREKERAYENAIWPSYFSSYIIIGKEKAEGGLGRDAKRKLRQKLVDIARALAQGGKGKKRK